MLSNDVILKMLDNDAFDLSKLPENVKMVEGGITFFKNALPTLVGVLKESYKVPENHFIQFELIPIKNDIHVRIVEYNHIDGKDVYIKICYEGEIFQLVQLLKSKIPFNLDSKPPQ